MKRLIATVFSLYLIVAVIVSVIHIMVEYYNVRHQIMEDITSIYISSEVPLSTAIWNFNSEQVDRIVNGLATLNFISRVTVIGSDGDPNISVGEANLTTALKYQKNIVYREKLLKNPLGTITFYTDHSVIIDRIKVNVFFIIANAIIKTFFLSLIILVVGSLVIGKPLKDLLDSVRRINIEDKDSIMHGKIVMTQKRFHQRKNELTDLVETYNDTLDKLYQRTDQRDEARKKLEQKNKNLEHLVNQKTIALSDKVDELNKINEKLEILASTDSLTGLLNRRVFLEQATIELGRLKRNREFAAIFIVDIDNFKTVNDSYGHPAGDAVLVSVANILKENIREYDIVSRFGGEEFSIMLKDIDLSRAAAMGERMRKTIALHTVIHEDQKINVTASFGLVMANSEAKSLDALFAHADKMLYRAKESGRNQLQY